MAVRNARLFETVQGKEQEHAELLHRVIVAQEEEREERRERGRGERGERLGRGRQDDLTRLRRHLLQRFGELPIERGFPGDRFVVHLEVFPDAKCFDCHVNWAT